MRAPERPNHWTKTAARRLLKNQSKLKTDETSEKAPAKRKMAETRISDSSIALLDFDGARTVRIFCDRDVDNIFGKQFFNLLRPFDEAQGAAVEVIAHA